MSTTNELKELIRRHTNQDDMDEGTCEYLASVLQEHDGDLEPIVSSCIQGEVPTDLLIEIQDLLSDTSSRPLDNKSGSPRMLDCLPSMSIVSKHDKADVSEPVSQPPKVKEGKRRAQTKLQNRTQKGKGVNTEQLNDFVDDDVSAWKDRQLEGKTWGGRGFGGRGVRGDVNTVTNIHLSNVTLQFAGNELLQSSTLQINGGHCYGLVGRNGCGKSTLLQRLAAHAIPGIPHDMRILLVKQQIEGGDDTALESLINADCDRLMLLKEQAEVEEAIESGVDLENNVNRLAAITNELELLDSNQSEERARGILKGLQFSDQMLDSPSKNLSGGWRMRLALAQALLIPSDLVLLDEPTNHLDLHALEWLSSFLAKRSHTFIMVSHDRTFLNVCTDIISFEHKMLKQYPGNYAEYERTQAEKAARQAQILDASERQRSKAMAFVRKQQNAASANNADPNKQRQAKMIKEKKLDRIGNYRDDGKRYKNFSLAQLSEKAVRVAQKVHIELDEPVIRMRFPDPTWASNVLLGSCLIRMDDVSFGYISGMNPLLKNLHIRIERGSKIAVVGRNGAGKSTLLKLLTGELDPRSSSFTFRGEIWRQPSLRVGHVSQYSVESLEEFGAMTVVQYAESFLQFGKASSITIRNASGNVRQYLGSFGLGGKHSHRTIASLSGGERMRLCFASVLAEEPNLLVLDEPTNHLDMETLDALASALLSYQGAVVIVSHNQGFLSGWCKELWVVEQSMVQIRLGDSFEALFSAYRKDASAASDERREKRQLNTVLAKAAREQNTRTKQGTGFVP